MQFGGVIGHELILDIDKVKHHDGAAIWVLYTIFLIIFVDFLARTAKLGQPVDVWIQLQLRRSHRVFETQTSTFDQMKAGDKARAQSPSTLPETISFEVNFSFARKSELS